MSKTTTTAVVTWNEQAAVTFLLLCLGLRIFLGWCLTPFAWLGSKLLNFRLRGMRLR
jgi:CBS domain containing-hemolysin-like protein